MKSEYMLQLIFHEGGKDFRKRLEEKFVEIYKKNVFAY